MKEEWKDMDGNEDAERKIMKCYEIIKMQILQIKKLAKRWNLIKIEMMRLKLGNEEIQN